MNFNPWQFTSPYISYTPILAEEVNPNFNGISASFTIVADELNQFRPRLPSNFSGNHEIPDGNYFNKLLGIDENGNMALVDKVEFQLGIDKDLQIIKSSDQQISVDGNNHSQFYDMSYAATGTESIEVLVGPAVAGVGETQGVTPGATILFNQNSDTPLTFAAMPGVTVRTPGLLQAYTRNATVALIAIDQFTWVLVGDIMPAEIEI